MEQVKQGPEATHRIRAGRVAVAAFSIAGLSASVVSLSNVAAAASREAKSVVVKTVKVAKFGTVLESGKTVYTLKPSGKGCTAACLKVWPELVLPAGVTKATAGSGVSASKLGTVTRAGGILQVTYSGKPLYSFVGDTAAGQVHGNVTDAWGKWSAVVTAKPVKSSSGSSKGSASSGGGVGF